MKNFNDERNKIKETDIYLYYALEIGGTVKAARHRKGFSQKRLSEMTGVSKMTVLRIENGDNLPNIDTLVKLMNALDLELQLTTQQKEEV
ncbi:XRE family transcriptional regulator [Bacillus phage 010DV004]|nr:XRE family transcriptional regulator [Bacillus phage 010DV004]QZA69430.1 XRE family transcriptional regulator [Bacillus phage 010DV005]QZA70000.1 XRE family transcriptional regulator [Bacillus phage 043JT007]